MKRWLWLPGAGLFIVACWAFFMVASLLVRVVSRIEYSDEPVVSEWSLESGAPVPDQIKSLAREGPGATLERAIMVKQNFYRLFGGRSPRPVITQFTCWKVVDAALQADILKHVRVPDRRYSSMVDTCQSSRFKPKWWPADLTPFLPLENRFKVRSAQFVSLSDRTHLFFYWN